MSQHRAILAKLALAWVGIACAIRHTSDDGMVLLFQEDAREFLVNLTDRPGELTVLGQGGPPSHSSHPTPPASPRMSPHTLQETSSFESRHVGGSGLSNVRAGSSPSLAMLAGGTGGTVRGSSVSSTMAGPGLSGDGADGLSAEVPQAGESSASGNSGLRAALPQRAAGTAGLDSPHADGGSVPLDPFGRGSSGGGVSTPPRSMSPGPTTFINRMPNPFTGGPAGVPAFVVAAAPPLVVAWPFSQPEICTVAVRVQGHSRLAPAVGAASAGGRRRGDDSAGGKERADLMFLSTGSSGWGGGTGSFFGGEHVPIPLAEVPVHPRSPPLPLPVSTPPVAAAVLENHPGSAYGSGSTLAELAPAMAPASFDASIGVRAASPVDLPSSVSAPMPHHGSASQRAHHSGHFASAFDADIDSGRHPQAAAAIAIKSHDQAQVHVPHAYTSPPSRPPIAPRASMSPPTGSPRRVTFDQAPEPAFERVPSSGRSVRSGAQSPTAPPPDLQPDAAAMQLSGLASEEMPWWGGSSRLEGSILVSERSRGSSEQIQHTDYGGSPLSTRAATPEPESEWGETPTSRTAKFPTILEAPEPAPRAAALASAFSGGSRTASSSGDEWKWGAPGCRAEEGPPIACGLPTAFSGSSVDGTDENGASAPRSPSKAAVLASPFGGSEDEADGDSAPVGSGGGPPGVVSGGTAAVLASPFGGDSSGDEDGAGLWGSRGGGATATAFASPFQEDDASSWALGQAGNRDGGAGNSVAPRSDSGAMRWRKEASVRMGVVPSLMSPFGGDGDDDDEDDEGGPQWYRGRGQSRDWDTTASAGSAERMASTGDGAAVVPNGRAGAGAPLPPGRKPSRPRSSSAHRRTYPFSRKPPSRAGYSSSTDEEMATELGGCSGAAALQMTSVAGGGSTAPAESAQASLGGGGAAEMSGAMSLDYQSAVLPSAEANLRALVANKSVHTMEAQFRMWISSSDITMTEEVIGRGSYGQVRPCAWP